jgi:twitching motility protein PilT
VSTAEDPVEFNFAGINQVQMHEDIGLNFASALRSFLRQDPDTIMIGEIRDFETAEIAVKAALTGHLVLSTLHTNDAPSTVTRLLNMGIEPFNVTASLNLILAQRLCRALSELQAAGAGVDEKAYTDAGIPQEKIGTFTPTRRSAARNATTAATGPRRRLRGHALLGRLKEIVINGASPPRSSRRRFAWACRRCACRRSTRSCRAPAPSKRPSATPLPIASDSLATRSSNKKDVNAVANLHQLLKAMVEKGASDLHITTGSPPQLRIDGDLVPLKMAPLSPVETKQLCYSILTDAQKHAFEENNELDLSFGVKGSRGSREHLHAARGRRRRLPHHSLQDPHLPGARAAAGRRRSLEEAARSHPRHGAHGLGQVDDAGVDHRQDQHRASRAHHDDRGPDRVPAPAQELPGEPARGRRRHEVVQDRAQVHLRQDPDVVLVGEMRDLETIEAALVIAETGHIAFATLHTNSAVQTINRIVDVFPPYQQPQVRAQLSFVLEGIMSQSLLPKASGNGRVLALEIMIPNPAIRNLIREDKVHQIYSSMQVGQSKFGMQTFNQALGQLLSRKLISMEEAFARTSDADELKNILATGQGGGMQLPGHTAQSGLPTRAPPGR